jgi:GTP-binding protein HflX
MNKLSKSDVFAENKLFATLDTTVRKVVIDRLPFLLSDTVGFIRKLPTHLVESFKSTLDETRESDMLIHVVDISHPRFEEQIQVVKETLRDIGTINKPTLLVFNKTDAFTHIPKDEDDLTPKGKENLCLDDFKSMYLAEENTPCVFISAKSGDNMDEFKSKLFEIVKELHFERYPYNRI